MHGDARESAFRIVIEYDGTAFAGWQKQARERTVQGELESALMRLTGATVRTAGAGRTDAGCHAAGQVASFTLTTRLTADRLRPALNAHLPEDVRVVEAADAPPGFHARFRAMRRSYRYLIVPPPSALHRKRAWVRPTRVPADRLNAASGPLLGEHDFTTFSKQGGDAVSPVCRVTRARWRGRGGAYRFDIEADRFLYTMVRRVVSTVLRAAEAGGGAHAVRAALDARDRRAAAPPAPAHGLYLMRIRYPRVGWIPKERTNVVG
ncbi:MAG TPA: tRNA pseudouridine(38-40) synthase TruA [Candidatus Eisenbacteria bacterium]